jgi:hypothetical protein
MKRYFVILIALFVSAAVYAQHRDRKGVIHVQGHPHELLTIKHGGKEDVKTKLQLKVTETDSIKLSDIKCWAGGLDPDIARVDSAVLVIKFTSVPGEFAGDSILIWGYHWNPVNKKGYDVHKYTIDMIRAVANADCRFLALLQNSSGGDFTAGGFGYNYGDDVYRPGVRFNYDAAVADTLVEFYYADSINCAMAQGADPYDVTGQWQEALKRGGAYPFSAVTGPGNGIIRHPFDADYGYPAYDFDYWERYFPGLERPYTWQAGWNYNYWAFLSKDQLNGSFDFSDYGITTREIHHGYVDGFAFNDVNAWPLEHDMSGPYKALYDCNCGCAGNQTGVEQNNNKK